MKNVAVVKYNAGNIYSVIHALGRLGIQPIVTDDAATLRTADYVIFPGQGEACKTMDYLRSHALDKLICSLTQPVLGICIGMQLMCAHSEEGDTNCLGIFDVPVKKFHAPKHEFKIPHMGWDTLTQVKGNLFHEIKEESFVYFIHSYYVALCPDTIATNDYILPFSAAIHKDNFYATQFHPEKSGSIGEKILQNFLELPLNTHTA
jgi:glutamine amidotransferase